MDVNILIGGTYQVGRRIGAGNFGELRLAEHIYNNEHVAVKLERANSRIPQLGEEYGFYKRLGKQEGFATASFYGPYGTNWNALVIELLGPNLEDLFDICERKFSVKTVAMIAIQTLSRLEYFHNHKLIYRDIKPENFLIGRPSRNRHNLIHLIDFGLAKDYIDTRTKQHIPFKTNGNLIGTARYMSTNVHMGYEQSRRDDLESLGYMYMYFLRGSLPWQGLNADTLKDRYIKIGETKKNVPMTTLCHGFPRAFYEYLRYVRGLQFTQKPDYDYLRRIFFQLLTELDTEPDWIFDWSLRLYRDREGAQINQPLPAPDKNVEKIPENIAEPLRAPSPRMLSWFGSPNKSGKTSKHSSLTPTSPNPPETKKAKRSKCFPCLS